MSEPQTTEAAVGRREPVAIVGIACRLPKAPDPDAFWELLCAGVEAVGEPSAGRWRDVGEPSMPIRRAGFLDRVDTFDAAFFGISPRAATAMDPQQRLMLELSWEVFEEARIVPASVRNSRTGVFVGAIWDDYATLSYRGGVEAISPYTVTGLQRGILANRVSYHFGLAGPSMTIDTGQSSSLVAVQLACESLRRGESTLAVAAGVNLIMVPESTAGMARAGALSPDGRCHTFDARANGYARGEGGAAVLLKPLARAVADGDRVHAVILGGAVNNDGVAEGLTVPSRAAQEEVLRLACADAGVDPLDVQYVELHGTGTRVGDPVEASALGHALGAGRPADAPLLVGAAKTNVGHLEGAAGIVGLLKTVLALRHRYLPASLNFTRANPAIPLDDLRLRVQQRAGDWPRPQVPLLAGVSSFGIGGTNCHLVLTTAPEQPPRPDPATGSAPEVTAWPLSARGGSALRDQATNLLRHLDARPDLDPAVVAHSLATTRTRFDHRAVVVAGTLAEARAALTALRQGQPDPGLVTGTPTPGKVVFAFPGQGSQWDAMARGLLDRHPVFTAWLRRCAEALAPYTDWNLLDVLRDEPDAPPLDRVDVLQPALWAMIISLAETWRAHGVEPDAVIGHSQGEIAAAYVAGALTLDESARIVARRAQAITAIAGTGGMVSVPLPPDQVDLTRWAGRLHVGALDGPRATVVSGDLDALDEVVATYAERGLTCHRVNVDHAAHTHHVEPLRERWDEMLGELRPTATRIPFWSTVAAGPVDGTALTTDYWYANLRNPVRLDETVRELAAAGHTHFIEPSPHPVLVVGIQDTLDTTDRAGTSTGTLRRADGGLRRLLLSLAVTHARTGRTPVLAVDPHRLPDRTVDLPTYPFQRESYWITAPGGTTPVRDGRHRFLETGIDLAGGGTLFSGRLSRRTHPWLADHAVGDTVLLPHTALVDLAAYAADRTGCGLVDDLVSEAPLVLPSAGGVELQVAVSPGDTPLRRTLTVHSRPDAAPGTDRSWVRHATGTLTVAGPGDDGPRLDQWPPAGAEPWDLTDAYARLADAGHRYGPTFRGLRRAWRAGEDLYAEVRLVDAQPVTGFHVHPALLDAALHPLALRLLDAEPRSGVALACVWSGVRVHAVAGTALRVHVRPTGPRSAGLTVTDESGSPVVEVASLTLRTVATGRLAVADAPGGSPGGLDRLLRAGTT